MTFVPSPAWKYVENEIYEYSKELVGLNVDDMAVSSNVFVL